MVSTKEEVETHNKTAQSDNESENDQDRKKIKKVLSLIQTLTSLSDRQQMAEQLLDKYQVIKRFSGLLFFFFVTSSYP